LKFLSWVTQFLADLSSRSLPPSRELREQLDRASPSALLNTAEGNGRRQGRQRAKFFDDARGSAIECAACLDASLAKGFASLDRIQAGKEMLVRIVAMRFDPEQYRVHERAAGLAYLRRSSTSTTTSTIDQGRLQQGFRSDDPLRRRVDYSNPLGTLCHKPCGSCIGHAQRGSRPGEDWKFYANTDELQRLIFTN
jgi:four helix bundle protein